jgi:phthalate 4,5-dioxygenase oxygenase subunit
MQSREENELLTRVGPGTPMGDLMRRYWMPVLLSPELERGGRPKRVRLLGEDLVALRARSGRVGLLGEFCSHRGASLYFGRNEEAGLRCVYHGWQFGLDGQCLDMPNEPAESSVPDKVRHCAYPCAVRGGVIWAFMGPASSPPSLPDLEWALVPEAQRFVSKFYQECNYLQALEGGIDPAHISFLHGVVDGGDEGLRRLDRAAAGFALAAQLERAPRIEVVDTSYGALIAARRDAGDGRYYWRITQFHMPFHTMPPTDPKADPVMHSHVWIPVDDENLVNWCVSWHPTRALTAEERDSMGAGLSIHITTYVEPTDEPYGDIRPLANRRNDYLIDWQAHQTQKFFGVPGVGAQDKAITESQRPIYDRTRERLGRADLGLIRIRKRLLDAALALRERGTPPPGMEPRSFLIRPASVLLPKDVPWIEGAREQLVASAMDAVPSRPTPAPPPGAR